ncbi:MAG: tRNA (adenosine(37)-N6)-threonylcarbamoyltransferase complex dimerization subunit type 1 TsaB [Paludibacteraceae bacterium]|nr:tRNA (adenosine(37)-N6)-threonylcarbamoyltransferase complex dimerization subunit type 1 TsaB [Paludibacteraceae bacterium]
MTILSIETSTNCCSAAIAINGHTVANRETLAGANHASDLPLFIQSLLDEAKSQNWTLDAVALSQGPGSYTGLRIGASLAKGLCYGLNIPLIPIDTLQLLCAAASILLPSSLTSTPILCPMLDARRMEVYTAFYTTALEKTKDVEAKIIDQDSFAQELSEHTIYFFGNGADKCKTTITSTNAHFIDNILPQAKYMGALAEEAHQLDIKQVAYYEPFYLKEFVAAPSHIKGLETK